MPNVLYIDCNVPVLIELPIITILKCTSYKCKKYSIFLNFYLKLENLTGNSNETFKSPCETTSVKSPCLMLMMLDNQSLSSSGEVESITPCALVCTFKNYYLLISIEHNRGLEQLHSILKNIYQRCH